MKNNNQIRTAGGLTLLTGGNGKVGRRVARRLDSRGAKLRIGSRSGAPAFDWEDAGTWAAALDGVTAAYIAYAPDLAVPGAAATIRAFVARAVDAGVRRLVLLSGRGEEEAQACERIVQASGVDWTIVRAGWFMQNFSEGEFLPMVLDGAFTLPARDIREPFIDVNDIADVAAAALSEDGHAGEVYEVTGPRALTFTELAGEISAATGREVSFVRIPHEAFAAALADAGVPADVAWLLKYLFATVLDGRNTEVCNGVQRALGREPADFTDFVRRVAARGTWDADSAEAAA